MESRERLNHYELGDRLGAGGMGQVYRATDTRLGRQVAIKLLPDDVAADPVRLARLQREARLLAQVNHPNIVTVYSIEEADGVQFITMELVEGVGLDDLLAGEALQLSRFFELALPLVDALTTAHAKGITHRDLKPANVMVGAGDRVCVLDFGLAKNEVLPTDGESATRAPEAITGEGVIIGTIAYMSPEQAEGKPIDQRTDVFSLGVLLYEMLTGRPPFRGDTPMAILSAIIRETPPAVNEVNPGLPGHLGRILRRCLEKDPALRYDSALELRNDLADLRRELASGEHQPKPEQELARIAEATRKQYRNRLVARTDESEQVQWLLEHALQGEGGMVMIGGEPGVGKTRLAWEMLEWARQNGFVGAIGHCYERDVSTPYGPWVEIMETAAQIVPAPTLKTLLGDAAPEIAKLLPELRRIYPDLPPAIDLPPEESRRFLFRSFREFLERAAALRPLCFVLDDLHWADDSTLLLLEHLAPHLRSLPIAILCTYRNVELEVGRPFAKTLRELVRERLTERVSLRRLTESGVAEMIEALAGSAPPEALVRAIFHATEGNPFFVEEVYQHLDEEGRLRDADGNWLTVDPETLDVPEGVRLVVGRRLEHLEPEEVKILTAAAVAGRRFSYAVLEGMPRMDPDVLLDALEKAERLQLIRPPKGRAREPRFVFTHELIRQTLLDGLLLPRRQRLHLQIAESMERVYAGDLDEHAAAIGHHLYLAGAAADEDKTVRFLERSAELFLAAGGFENVVDRCDKALALIDPDDDRAGRLRMLRGQAYRSLGRSEEALEELQRALPILARTAEPRLVADCAEDTANLLLWRNRMSEALAVLDVGFEALGDELSNEHCRLGAVRTLCVGSDEAQIADARREADEWLERAVEIGDPVTIATCKSTAVFGWNVTGEYAGLVDAAEDAVRACEAAGLEWARTEVLAIQAVAHALCADFERARELERQTRESAKRIGNDHVEMVLIVIEIRRAARRGDRARFSEHVGAFQSWCERHEGGFAVIAHYYAAIDVLLAGDTQQMIASAERGRESVRDFTIYQGYAETAELLARAYSDQTARVLEGWERFRSEDLLPRAGQSSSTGAKARLVDGVECLAMIGRLELAGPHYETLNEILGAAPLLTRAGWINGEAIIGLAAHGAGRTEDAENHFAEAVEFAHTHDFDFALAEALRFHALTLLDRPDPDRGRIEEMLGEAEAIYEALETPLHARHTASLRARNGEG